MSDRWSVGELAKASGVTVRALHYYDEIGLVRPAERTSAGHRRYTDGDVHRLYRVRALFQLGVPLEDIPAVLDSAADDLRDLRDLLAAQLADLDAKAARLGELRRQVRRLLDDLDGARTPEPARFLAALELTVPVVDPEPYLTAEQRAALDRHAAGLGDRAVDDLRAEFLDVVRRLRDLLRDGVPPADERVRALAARWREIGQTLQPAGTDLGAATARMWGERGTAVDQALAGRVSWLDPGDLGAVVDYVRRSR